MIRKALEYINELAQPHVLERDGRTYADKDMEEISSLRYAKQFELTTLTSLLDYLKSGVDDMPHMFVHVKSPTCVEVFSKLDGDRKRETLVVVNACLPILSVNTWVDRENFNIALQSKFAPTPDRDLLLQFVGTVESGSVTEYGDDGVTQTAVIKTGIAKKETAIIPNPVALRPYRTFLEVEQPESSFVYRMRDDGRGVSCAIYEADGGAWRNEAVANVHAYLANDLADCDNFTVIS